ncbi:MAG: hypothetical protein Q7K43_00840 [Candidatus Woesearchaeota archaeon]|nr:hypothetical protein [Candidatus Woesearchaeota archaeon]
MSEDTVLTDQVLTFLNTVAVYCHQEFHRLNGVSEAYRDQMFVARHVFLRMHDSVRADYFAGLFRNRKIHSELIHSELTTLVVSLQYGLNNEDKHFKEILLLSDTGNVQQVIDSVVNELGKWILAGVGVTGDILKNQLRKELKLAQPKFSHGDLIKI